MYNLLIVDDESMVRLGMKSCVDWERLQVDNVYEAFGRAMLRNPAWGSEL